VSESRGTGNLGNKELHVSNLGGAKISNILEHTTQNLVKTDGFLGFSKRYCL
jgi:hypothetical protein